VINLPFRRNLQARHVARLACATSCGTAARGENDSHELALFLSFQPDHAVRVGNNHGAIVGARDTSNHSTGNSRSSVRRVRREKPVQEGVWCSRGRAHARCFAPERLCLSWLVVVARSLKETHSHKHKHTPSDAVFIRTQWRFLCCGVRWRACLFTRGNTLVPCACYWRLRRWRLDVTKKCWPRAQLFFCISVLNLAFQRSTLVTSLT